MAIDRRKALPAMTSKVDQLRALLLGPTLQTLPVVGALVAIYLALRRLRGLVRSFGLFSLGMAGLVWRERQLLRPATQPSNYLRDAARAIDEVLRSEGRGVPFYVFGHTHEAEQFPLAALGERGPEPRYLNSWTRTSVVGATGFDLLRARERFTFVQITRDPERGTPVGRLMHWHAAAGRADVLPVMQG